MRNEERHFGSEDNRYGLDSGGFIAPLVLVFLGVDRGGPSGISLANPVLPAIPLCRDSIAQVLSYAVSVQRGWNRPRLLSSMRAKLSYQNRAVPLATALRSVHHYQSYPLSRIAADVSSVMKFSSTLGYGRVGCYWVLRQLGSEP